MLVGLLAGAIVSASWWSHAATASDGREFLVVWDDSREGGLYAARVALDGSLLDPGGVLLSRTARTFPEITVLEHGGFLLRWTEGEASRSLTVDEAGPVATR